MESLKRHGCEQIKETKHFFKGGIGKPVMNFLIYWWWMQRNGEQN